MKTLTLFCILKHLHLNDSFQDERWRKGDGGDNGANEIGQCQNGAQLVGPPVCKVLGECELRIQPNVLLGALTKRRVVQVGLALVGLLLDLSKTW